MPGLDEVHAGKKTGDERFRERGKGLPFDLKSFWQWSASDLLSNVTRGVMAEFLVAKAVGLADESIRKEWDPFDLVTPEGIKVEVKSSAYLQSWTQRELSKVRFQVPKTQAWDYATNKWGTEKARHADVYVFALLAHEDKSTVDPMDLDQWTFYVIPTTTLNVLDRSSLRIQDLDDHAEPLQFGQIREAVLFSQK